MYMHNKTTEYGLKKILFLVPDSFCPLYRVFICLYLLHDHLKMLYTDAELFCQTHLIFLKFDSLYWLDNLLMSLSVIGVMDLSSIVVPKALLSTASSLTQKQVNVYKHVFLDV